MSQDVENAVQTAPVLRITVSDVLGLLAQGKSRKEIAEHYGRTQSDMNKMVWGHPKLKNRKAKKQYTGIELEDDTEDINDAMIDVEVTQETLDMNPDLVAEGVQVGEVLQVEAEEVAQVPGTEATQAFTTPDTSDWN
jgi:hypothetical protein